ncbi:hypothetical protein [Microbispora bryophytorum]|uniref:hypothetical protein n=1 Tax=Microbispora bryophytorum TaxID=1460882 RepID=UPI0033C19ABC
MSRYGYGYGRRRTKSSDEIALGALGVLAAVVIGAVVVATDSDEEDQAVTADCVDTSTIADDGSYQAVDDRFCDGGSHASYVYVYGGNYSGGRVRGGSTTRPGNVGINTRSGRVVVRGGFGGRAGGGGG